MIISSVSIKVYGVYLGLIVIKGVGCGSLSTETVNRHDKRTQQYYKVTTYYDLSTTYTQCTHNVQVFSPVLSEQY